MMGRYEELHEILAKRKFFKLVCGAGNEDLKEVERLALVYTLAGAHMHDLSANVEVVEAAKRGVERAYDLASHFNREIAVRPYLNVSIGIKGDPHVRKAKIDGEKCEQCGECISACRQEAIPDNFIVLEQLCIGCGDCERCCPSGAIKFFHKKADFDKILPECAARGVETMELHAVSNDDEAVAHNWLLLKKIIPDNYLSVCIDRSLLSNKHLVQRIQSLYEISRERLIVQADGVPMSGEGDDFNTTLQAVACADIVIKSGIPAMVLLSGGTNTKTGELAQQCGVCAHGVAIGSFARKIVKQYLVRDDFDSNKNILSEAINVAEILIKTNIEAING
jgi:Fe-S-cluster-containing hydrogenase component 2